MLRSNKILLAAAILLTIACKSGSEIVDHTSIDYRLSETPVSEILADIPNYSGLINAVEGRGRAIVSEPGNSERFNIDFASDTTFSLLTIKNRLGIEGGAMLVDPDSILMYFKVGKIAQKVSITDGRLTSLNELASINLIDLLHFKLSEESVLEAYEADDHYLLRLTTDGGARIGKSSNLVEEVTQPFSAGLPYSNIIYENYGELDGYRLPRKITIFSADGESKVVFQVRSLNLNSRSLDLTLDIPSDIIIDRL
jgi:hypothetical protein